MPDWFRRRVRRSIAVTLWGLFLTVGALAWADTSTETRSDPTQRTLRIAAGPSEGTYIIIAEAIRQAAVRSGMEVEFEILRTSGSVENIQIVARGDADLGLAQNDALGLAKEALSPGSALPWSAIVALLQEPVQVVAGPAVRGTAVEAVAGQPVALGWEGSGTQLTAGRLLRTLDLAADAVPCADKASVVDTMRKGTAHAGFFISNIPDPHVSALLSDPGYRLLRFDSAQLQALQRSSPDYVITEIPESTYPNQRRSLTTIGVATILVARPELDETIVESLSDAILRDSASRSSFLRRVRTDVRLPAILDLTHYAAVPLHPGSQRAIDTLPLSLRLQEYFHWVVWVGFFAATVFLGTFAAARRLRLFLTRLASRFLPSGTYHLVRYLFFYRPAWTALRTVTLLGLLWLVGSAAMFLVERRVNTHFATLYDSALSIIVYIFSGLEDRTPFTPSGWIVSIIMLVTGLVVAANITGYVASELIVRTRGAMLTIGRLPMHEFVIIGWNSRSERVLRELSDAFKSGVGHRSVLVVTPKALDITITARWESEAFAFAHGETFHKEFLKRVRVHEAEAVIVMTDEDAADPDGATALTVLAIRSILRDPKARPSTEKTAPRIVCEVRNHRKMDLIRDAGADEIVCHEDFGLGALVQSALQRGISSVYDELLSFRGDTCEVYVLRGPGNGSDGDIAKDSWDHFFRGKKFRQAAILLQERPDKANPCILLGLRRGRELLLNPREDEPISDRDDIVVMSYTRPTLRKPLDEQGPNSD